MCELFSLSVILDHALFKIQWWSIKTDGDTQWSFAAIDLITKTQLQQVCLTKQNPSALPHFPDSPMKLKHGSNCMIIWGWQSINYGQLTQKMPMWVQLAQRFCILQTHVWFVIVIGRMEFDITMMFERETHETVTNVHVEKSTKET